MTEKNFFGQPRKASAPIAAAILALALEANPELNWRDMQHLLGTVVPFFSIWSHLIFMKMAFPAFLGKFGAFWSSFVNILWVLQDIG